MLGAVDYGPGDCLPVHNLTPNDGGNNSFALTLSQSGTLLEQPRPLCNRSTGSNRDPLSHYCHKRQYFSLPNVP
jgi:hypothetical protein